MEKIKLNVESNNSDIMTKVKKNATYLDTKMDWTIKFSMPLEKSTINSNNMYVADSKNQKIKVSFTYDDATNSLSIKPTGEYKANEHYHLVLTKKVKAKKGGYLNNELVINFAQETISRQNSVKSTPKDIKSTEATSVEETKAPASDNESKSEIIKNNLVKEEDATRKSLINHQQELTMQEKYGDKLKEFHKSFLEFEGRSQK